MKEGVKTEVTLSLERQIVKKTHLYSLDYLRGFAALSVCLLHFTYGYLPNLRNLPVKYFFNWGYMGVHIFFIVSGFVMPFSLFKIGYKPKNFYAFIVKRIVRIGPPSYIAIFLLVAQRIFIDFFIKHERVYTANLTWHQIVNNIFYTVPYTSDSWLNGVLWTLAVEFQFYFILGILFMLLKKRWLYFLIFAIICNIINFLHLIPVVQFFEYSLLFILGLLVWLKYDYLISNKVFFSLLIINLVGIYIQYYYVVCIVSCVTIVFIFFVKVKSRFFAFLGKISYSLYLLHTLVGTTIEAFWVKLLPLETLFQKYMLLLAAVLGAIVASYVYYISIEMIFIKLSGRLFKIKDG